jgi:F-type H+-transporting ATPase subunit delta
MRAGGGEATAKSYARALFELARERDQIDTIGTELGAAADLLAAQPALRDFLSRPWVSAAAKRGAAGDVATRLGVSPLVRDFIALVAVRNRADHLAAIQTAYRALVDEHRRRVRVKLRTAIRFSDAERETLGRRLSQVLEGRELVIDESVDPTLLGGFVAEIRSMILDGSLDTQIVRMRDQLARA